jgi:L-ascorbate metabolism protein UlaG (beta-lactamase superfamily)
MQIHFLRHATFILKLKEIQLLIDPMLSKAKTLDSIPKSSKKINPMVELPLSDAELSQVLGQINGVLVSHTHPDHWDPRAMELLPKNIPIFYQSSDESKISGAGFTNVIKIQDEHSWNGITFHRTDGEHGRGDNAKNLGPVSGFVVRSEGEPTLYIAGDTVWCEKVEDAIKNFTPNVIVVNAGAAFLNGGAITMTAEDVVTTCKAPPSSARVVAVHMEVMNHCRLTREGLRQVLAKEKLEERVVIPVDGDVLTF